MGRRGNPRKPADPHSIALILLPCLCRLSRSGPDRTSSVSPVQLGPTYTLVAGKTGRCNSYFSKCFNRGVPPATRGANRGCTSTPREKDAIKIKKRKKKKRTRQASETKASPSRRASREKNRRKSNGVVCQFTRHGENKIHDSHTHTHWFLFLFFFLSRTLSLSLLFSLSL